MAGYKTTFNNQWTDKTLCPDLALWIQSVPDNPFMAKCIWCSSLVSLSNMGRQALSSHSKGAKHLKNARRYQDSNVTTMTQFLNVQKHDHNSSVASGVLPESAANNAALAETVTDANVVSGKEPVAVQTVVTKARKITAFTSRDDVTRAEILWTMKMVKNHYSYRSSDDMNLLFQSMFPDSSIAKQLSFGRTEVSYIVSFGLAPYLHQAVIDGVK